MTNDPNPSTPCGAYNIMSPWWQMIADIRAGGEAVRRKKEAYLPKFPDEDQKDYDRRVKSAPWRPEFTDALRALASKPFAREIEVENANSGELKAFVEDVDAKGSNLTQFAKPLFENAVADGVAGIFVEHTPNGGARTLADEKASGARPYFIRIDAQSLISVYFGMVNGELRPIYVRFKECVVERNGFGEKTIEQIRELEPGIWRLYRQNEKKEWEQFGEDGKTSLTYVPLVLFFTGDRMGDYLVRPPLLDLADLQIELYRALAREDEIMTYAGFPMLTGNGIEPTKEPVIMGPRRVLFAPPSDGGATSWAFIQPDAAVLQEVGNKVDRIAQDMRRLGMQPVTQKAGTVTATATSVEAAKSHTVLQAWALSMKDALEQAFVMVNDYIKGSDKVEVSVFTDFAAEPFAQAPLTALTEARKLKDISAHTYRNGLKRFDVLPADLDNEDEDLVLASEQEGLQPDQPMDPITGELIQQNSGA